jgi:cobalt-zinc-cadmium efflux system outer membrane protein
VADATLGLLAADRQVVALDLLAETGRRFVDTARAGERLRIARLALAQTAATLALVKPRVASASSPRTELLDAEVRHSTARVAVANAERDLDAARLSLAAQWGDLTARPDTQFDLNNVPAMPPFESLLARLDNLPDLTRFASETQLRAAELRLARAQAVADWRWSLGVRRYEAEGEQALIAGFSLPLGVEKRAEPLAREAQVQLQRVDAQAAALRLRLQPLLYAQLQLLANARARVASITDDELPRLQDAAKLTERGYRMGRFPYRDLAQAQQRIVEAEIARVDAAAEYHLTNIEVQRLVGTQLELLSESKL